ncbi:heavy metal transport/detoxification protein [marine bacterium AO1-C]|nr:heavy metal transport/detoxification protein [marine bacterium AO1-C]
MNTFKFKTNIQCNGCLTQVTPYLNELPNITHWEVDLTTPNKTLTVQANNSNAPNQVIDKLKEAGFEGNKIE